jgi:hypothetical protein
MEGQNAGLFLNLVLGVSFDVSVQNWTYVEAGEQVFVPDGFALVCVPSPAPALLPALASVSAWSDVARRVLPPCPLGLPPSVPVGREGVLADLAVVSVGPSKLVSGPDFAEMRQDLWRDPAILGVSSVGLSWFDAELRGMCPRQLGEGEVGFETDERCWMAMGERLDAECGFDLVNESTFGSCCVDWDAETAAAAVSSILRQAVVPLAEQCLRLGAEHEEDGGSCGYFRFCKQRWMERRHRRARLCAGVEDTFERALAGLGSFDVSELGKSASSVTECARPRRARAVTVVRPACELSDEPMRQKWRSRFSLLRRYKHSSDPFRLSVLRGICQESVVEMEDVSATSVLSPIRKVLNDAFVSCLPDVAVVGQRYYERARRKVVVRATAPVEMGLVLRVANCPVVCESVRCVRFSPEFTAREKRFRVRARRSMRGASFGNVLNASEKRARELRACDAMNLQRPEQLTSNQDVELRSLEVAPGLYGGRCGVVPVFFRVPPHWRRHGRGFSSDEDGDGPSAAVSKCVFESVGGESSVGSEEGYPNVIAAASLPFPVGWRITSGMEMEGTTDFAAVKNTFLKLAWLSNARAWNHLPETAFNGESIADREWVLSLLDGLPYHLDYWHGRYGIFSCGQTMCECEVVDITCLRLKEGVSFLSAVVAM